MGLIALAATGCADGKAKPPAAQDSPKTASTDRLGRPAQQLAVRAALAGDQTFTADYRLTDTNGGQATAKVSKLADSLRFEISYPATDATVAHTVTLLQNSSGIFRCISTTTGKGCLLAAKPGEDLPNDPRLQHVFGDWLPKLANRSAALSIEATTTFGTVRGDCFSLERVTSSVAPPVDTGVYCFDADGLVTGVRLDAGTLELVTVAGPPANNALPAEVTNTVPETTPPPSPSPSPQ